MENQHDNSSLNASQDYLQEHAPANNGWMNKITSALPSSVRQYGTNAVSQVRSMSTTQKVAGGALLAAGAYYLANREAVNSKVQQKYASWSQPRGNSAGATDSPTAAITSKSKSRSKAKSE